MKYIIFNRGGLEVPVILTAVEKHSDYFKPGDKVVSAGEVRFVIDESEMGNEVQARCGGESVTLGVKSRGEVDAAIITRANEAY